MPSTHRMPRLPIALLSWMVLCGWGAAIGDARAQSGETVPPLGGAQKDKSDLHIELPPDMKPAPVTAATTPEELVQRRTRDLSRYPLPAAGRAIQELVLAGPLVVPPLKLVLNGLDPQPKVAAAIALAELGDADSIPAIEQLIADKRQARHLGPLLEALHRLNPDRALATALALAKSKQPASREVGFQHLARTLRPEAAPALRDLLASSDPVARLRAFKLLDDLKVPGLEMEALKLVGDPDTQLAEKVSTWLVEHRSEPTSSELLRMAHEDPPTRAALWSLLTVAEIEERWSVVLLGEDLRPMLEPRLRSLDPLVRVSAAVALAQIGFRSQSEDVEELLGERVMPALMETFLRNEYFKDFLPLLHAASSRVQRITGLDLGEDLTRWRAAWLGSGGQRIIRRDLDPQRMPELADSIVLHWQRSGLLDRGADFDVALASEAQLGALAATEPRPLFIASSEFAALLKELVESGVLKGRAGSKEKVGGAGFRMLRLSAQNRERAVAVSGRPDAAFDAFELRLRGLVDSAFWQRLYAGKAESFPDYFRSEFPSQGAGTLAAKRRFLDQLLLTQKSVDEDTRREAIAVILRHPDLVASLGATEFDLILDGLSGETIPEGAGLLVCELALRRNDGAILQSTAQALIVRFGALAEPLLARLVEDSGVAIAALASPHAQLRLLGARYCTRNHCADAAALAPLLDDVDARVRREGLNALAASQDPAARAKVSEIARADDRGLRRAAIEALAQDAGADALALLLQLMQSTDKGVPEVACRALARRGKSGVDALLSAAGDAPSDAIVTALTEESNEATTLALEGLLEKANGAQAETIAYALAARKRMSGVPVLLRVFDHPERADRARDALELLLCCDGGERGELFVKRFNDAPSQTPDDWFEQALGAKKLAADEPAQIGGIALPVLTAALGDSRWYVRAHAASRLEDHFHAGIPVPTRFAAEPEVTTCARRWAAFLACRDSLEGHT